MKGLNRVSTRAFKAPITRMAGRTSLQEPCHTRTWYMAFCVIQLVEYRTEKSENALTHVVCRGRGPRTSPGTATILGGSDCFLVILNKTCV